MQKSYENHFFLTIEDFTQMVCSHLIRMTVYKCFNILKYTVSVNALTTARQIERRTDLMVLGLGCTPNKEAYSKVYLKVGLSWSPMCGPLMTEGLKLILGQPMEASMQFICSIRHFLKHIDQVME